MTEFYALNKIKANQDKITDIQNCEPEAIMDVYQASRAIKELEKENYNLCNFLLPKLKMLVAEIEGQIFIHESKSNQNGKNI